MTDAPTPQPIDIRAAVADLREILAKATPAPWTCEIEEYEEAWGTVTIPEIGRILHDPEWADPEDWQRDVDNALMLVAARNSLPGILDALEAALELRDELLCPIHVQLDRADKLEPFDNCVACIRVERDELRRAGKDLEIQKRLINDSVEARIATALRGEKS